MQDGSGHVLLSIQSFDYTNIKDGNGKPLGGNALGGRDTIMMVIDPSVDPNVDYNAFEKKAYRIGGRFKRTDIQALSHIGWRIYRRKLYNLDCYYTEQQRRHQQQAADNNYRNRQSPCLYREV